MPWRYEARVFHTNTESVTELLGFDQLIVKTAVDGLRSTASEITENYGLHVAVTKLNNRAAMLERIREGGHLRRAYETMFNQCVVLLVSYFGSAVHGVFRQGLIAALRSETAAPVSKQILSVSWSAFEQTQDSDRERIFSDLLIAQKEISFQDMQSIVRAFDDHLGIKLERTLHTDNIILGHASRHVIVHSAGSTIDEKMVKQVAGARLRTLKREEITRGRSLRFSPDEITTLADSMKAYLEMLCASLDTRFGMGVHTVE